MVSDLALLKELPEAMKKGMDSTSCVAGVIMKDEYIETIRMIGFEDVKLIGEKQYCSEDFADFRVQVISQSYPFSSLIQVSPVHRMSTSQVVSQDCRFCVSGESDVS